MNWFLSNLWIFISVGILAVGASFARFRFETPNKYLLFGGLAIVFLALAAAAYVAFGPPGRLDTVDEPPNDGPKPELPESALVRLRLEWDSEGQANWPAAETLAVVSNLAYDSPIDAKEALEELGFDKFITLAQNSMLGYAISGEDVTVLAFRGTNANEIGDWIGNFGLSSTDTPHGPVHSGFHSAYYSMKDQVDRILDQQKPKHLWITGHSLGGAIALMCAYDLAEAGHKVDGVITFGQPFVAKEEFAAYIDTMLLGRYARFVNGDDVITRSPPGHSPCGSLVWFTASGLRRSVPKRRSYSALEVGDPASVQIYDEVKPLNAAEFQQLQFQMRADDPPVGFRYGPPTTYSANLVLIDDHAMTAYLAKVRDLLGVEVD